MCIYEYHRQQDKHMFITCIIFYFIGPKGLLQYQSEYHQKRKEHVSLDIDVEIKKKIFYYFE